MSSVEKIKRLFAKSKITVSSKVDDRIVGDALTAFDEAEKTKSLSAGLTIWRIATNTRITRVAAAAIIVVILLLGVTFLGQAVTWSGSENIIYFGGAIALVILGLVASMFVTRDDKPDKPPK